MLDILIRNAQVIDGSGSAGFRADVAVEGGRIADVCVLEGATARRVIDATGSVVTPGFVDMHSHTDLMLPLVPTADSAVHQGITTSVTGMCGMTAAPIMEPTRREFEERNYSADAPLPFDHWSTFGEFLDYVREGGMALNIVPLVGQGAIRAAVMGYGQEKPTSEQMALMQREVLKAMDAGAIGVSTGLIYPPSSYATTREIVDITRLSGRRHGFYFSHIRGEAETLLEAISEAILIGRETGARVEIGHFKAAGEANWHKAAQALEAIEQAKLEGVSVTWDMYPYTRSSTMLSALLPGWAHSGSTEDVLRRLTDRTERARMAASMATETYFRSTPWDEVFISRSPRRREYEGHTVAELAEGAAETPEEWTFDALLEARLDVWMILTTISEDNLRMQLRHASTMVGTDGYGYAFSGPYAKGLPHPRSFGTFPCILGRYVREEHTLTLEDAVHRMTGLPAERLGWKSRGLLRKGCAADVVVFDPSTVADRATFEAPFQRPLGLSHVLVNGRLVVDAGVHTGALPGVVLGR